MLLLINILYNVCVFIYFYQFLKLLGLRACEYNISIMIRIKLELKLLIIWGYLLPISWQVIWQPPM